MIRFCEYCLKELDKTHKSFCSMKCKGKWQSKYSRGENSPHWKGGKVKIICSVCRNSFYNWKSKNQTYCNTCAKEIKFKNIEHTDKWKKKVSAKLKGQFSPAKKKALDYARSCRKFDEEWRKKIRKARQGQKPFPTHHTIPEMQFENICKKYNLPFRYVGDSSLWIENVNPDFVDCNSRKIAIEIFGEYWHNPQKRRIPYNQTVNGRKEILKKYGWECIIFWDYEIKENIILKRLKKYGYDKISV